MAAPRHTRESRSCLLYTSHERNFVLRPWAHLDPEATLRVGPTVAHPVRLVADVLVELGLSGVRPGPVWSPAW